ncbi:MAG: hypothetical protein ACI3XA_10385 [Clostridia bacterium]
MKIFLTLGVAIILAVAALVACNSNEAVEIEEIPTDVTEATIAE